MQRITLQLDVASDADADQRQRTVELAVAAESAGADGVWIVGTGAGAALSALHCAAAVAAHTERLAIGVAGIAIADLHPLRLAEDAASLDGIAGGRLELALATTTEPELESEVLELLERCWAPGPFHHRGPRHTFDGVDVHPKPFRPDGPPLWLDQAGGEAYAGAERAAAAGLGWIAETEAAAREYLERWAVERQEPDEARLALRRPLPGSDAGRPAAAPDALRAALAGGVEADGAAAHSTASADALSVLAEALGQPPHLDCILHVASDRGSL